MLAGVREGSKRSVTSTDLLILSHGYPDALGEITARGVWERTKTKTTAVR